jgi:hypothetical protein
MKLDRIDPEHGPTPEQLGAYADGELSSADRAAIDAWLCRHPDRAAEVEALRSLTQLWHDTPAPQPSAEAWSTVQNKIEARLRERPRGDGRDTRSPRRFPRYGLAVAAAAVLALVFLGKGQTPAPAEEEPYPVIDADDVVIMSISGDDCACLVAAQPPVTRIDDGDLATRDDVLVLNLEPHKDDGAVADLRVDDTSMMVLPPPGWERDP